jgi:hypothetical protein
MSFCAVEGGALFERNAAGRSYAQMAVSPAKEEIVFRCQHVGSSGQSNLDDNALGMRYNLSTIPFADIMGVTLFAEQNTGASSSQVVEITFVVLLRLGGEPAPAPSRLSLITVTPSNGDFRAISNLYATVLKPIIAASAFVRQSAPEQRARVLASAFALLSSDGAKEPFPREADAVEGSSSIEVDDGEDDGATSSALVAAELGPGWKEEEGVLEKLLGLRRVSEFVTAAVERKQAEPLAPFTEEHRRLTSDSGFEEVRRGRAAEAAAPRRALSAGEVVVVRIDHLPVESRPSNPDTEWFGCVVHQTTSTTTIMATDPGLEKGRPVPFEVSIDDVLISPASAGGSQVTFVMDELVLARFQANPADSSTGYYPARVVKERDGSFEVCFEGDDVDSRLVR